jgi:hypothetical protein
LLYLIYFSSPFLSSSLHFGIQTYGSVSHSSVQRLGSQI